MSRLLDRDEAYRAIAMRQAPHVAQTSTSSVPSSSLRSLVRGKKNGSDIIGCHATLPQRSSHTSDAATLPHKSPTPRQLAAFVPSGSNSEASTMLCDRFLASSRLRREQLHVCIQQLRPAATMSEHTMLLPQATEELMCRVWTSLTNLAGLIADEHRYSSNNDEDILPTTTAPSFALEDLAHARRGTTIVRNKKRVRSSSTHDSVIVEADTTHEALVDCISQLRRIAYPVEVSPSCVYQHGPSPLLRSCTDGRPVATWRSEGKPNAASTAATIASSCSSPPPSQLLQVDADALRLSSQSSGKVSPFGR